jgi:DNA polymerase I-like protein with 3'-5' exonuclease and polymerase domains
MSDFATYVSDRSNYKHPTTPAEIAQLSKNMQAHKALSMDQPIGLDTETYYNPDNKEAYIKWVFTSLNNEPFGLSLFFDGNGYWVTGDMIQELKPTLEDPDFWWVLHNSKYDLFMFSNIGIDVKGHIWDTMIMAQLIDEEMTLRSPDGKNIRSKKLKDIGYHYFRADAKELEEMVDDARAYIAKQRGIKKSEVSYKDVSDEYPDLMKDYAIFDTELCTKIFPIFKEELALQRLFGAYEIDITATRAVLELERRGIAVDMELMKKDHALLSEIAEGAADKAYALAKKSFNINSADELVGAMNEVGVYEWTHFTEDESYDVSKATLKSEVAHNEANQDLADMVSAVITYRKANKLMSTYIEQTISYVQNDGRVHCDYWVSPNDHNKGGTKTGRMSSSNPNMQNIPKKPITLTDLEGTEHVFNPRDYFVADPGAVLVFNDYDQQEYRVLGHYSGDEKFQQMIHDGLDIHKGTASIIFGVPYQDVTEDQRTQAKTTNFALVYGLGNASFAISLGHDIDKDRADLGTRGYLYKNYKPWEIPPYKDNAQDIINALPPDLPEDVVDGVFYYLTDKYQEAIKEAKATKDDYFKQFPKIKAFIKTCTDIVKRRRPPYAATWSGRRRHFKGPDEAYKAPNSIIQGGCGDVMKVKLPLLVDYCKTHNLKSYPVLSIHDEVGTMVFLDELEHAPVFRKILEDLPMFTVPITTGLEIGEKWGSKEEFDTIEQFMERVPPVTP